MRFAQPFGRAALLLVLAGLPLARAQVPPHAPGTICLTPRVWCPMPTRGPVGADCACATPRGWVRGRLV